MKKSWLPLPGTTARPAISAMTSWFPQIIPRNVIPLAQCTVDGCEILHHQKDGFSTLKWDQPPTNWCRISQPSTVYPIIVPVSPYCCLNTHEVSEIAASPHEIPMTDRSIPPIFFCWFESPIISTIPHSLDIPKHH